MKNDIEIGKRIMDCTDIELLQKIAILFDKQINNILDEREKQQSSKKVFTINQLVKMNIIGGRDRIKKLITNGFLKTLPDGKISESEINMYLKIINKNM